MQTPLTAAAGQSAQHTIPRGICPPNISADYPEQRYFCGDSPRFSHRVASNPDAGPLTKIGVYRNAHDDDARLTIEMVGAGEIHSHLSSIALREVAARLLDAAHDIEQHPAASLVAAAEPDRAAA
jgi:hypothetical protein